MSLPTPVRSPRRVLSRLLLLLAALAMLGTACSTSGSVDVSTDGAAPAAATDQLGGGSADAAAGDETVAPGSSDDGAGSSNASVAAATEPSASDARSIVESFEVSPALLAYAAEQVDAVDTFRFEMFQETTGSMLDIGSRDVPFVTGATSGSLARMDMDMSAMLGGMAMPGLSDADLGMRFIIDGTTMYIQAPFLAMIAETAGGESAPPEFAWMTHLATGWGRFDASALGDDSVLDEFGVGQGADADAMLAMLDEVGDVLDGGTSEVRGVPTRVVYATIDLAEAAAVMGETIDDATMAELGELPPTSLEVHIDDQSRVRRMAFTIDMGNLMPEAGLSDAKIWTQFDYFAFGEPVDVAIPADAIDITDDLIALGGF